MKEFPSRIENTASEKNLDQNKIKPIAFVSRFFVDIKSGTHISFPVYKEFPNDDSLEIYGVIDGEKIKVFQKNKNNNITQIAETNYSKTLIKKEL